MRELPRCVGRLERRELLELWGWRGRRGMRGEGEQGRLKRSGEYEESEMRVGRSEQWLIGAWEGAEYRTQVVF